MHNPARGPTDCSKRGSSLGLVIAFALLGELCVVGEDNTDDDTKDAECTGENLDDQNLDVERRVLGIREHTAAASDPHGDTMGITIHVVQVKSV
jgi:hypothetical protein